MAKLYHELADEDKRAARRFGAVANAAPRRRPRDGPRSGSRAHRFMCQVGFFYSLNTKVERDRERRTG